MWTEEKYQAYLEELNTKREEDYQKFQQKLISTSYPILGIRTPILRKFAKEISKTDIPSFLSLTKSQSFEEILVEGMVIASIKDPKLFKSYLEQFLPKIDNWATCDMCCSSFKMIKKEKEYFYPFIKKLAFSKKEFTARVGIVLLMNYYLEDDLEEILSLLDQIKTKGYYVDMAIAWLLSVALVKNYDETLSYLKKDKLNTFTHNKAIQKARESFRLTKEQKEELTLLKRKEK